LDSRLPSLRLKGKASSRRTLNDSVFIVVTVKAENTSQATGITNQVQQEDFKIDLEDSLTHITGFNVTVAKVLQPTTRNINVDTPTPENEQCPEKKTCDDGTEISCFGTDGDCDCEVCPTKEVKFEFQATMTVDQFIATRVNMTVKMADLLAVRRDYVHLELKGHQIRRTLNEGVSIVVTVKAENETQATAITKQVKQEDFKIELEDSLTDITGSKVTVEKVSQPRTTNINFATAKASDESKNNTVIIVVVVLSVLAVLGGAGALAYYHYFIYGGKLFNFFNEECADDLECANDLECTNDCDLKAAIESVDF